MLKTKTITTDKATLLVVELPEGAKNVRVNNARGIFGYTDKINIVRWEALEFGNWQLLGRIPDITEGYVYELIPEVITPIMGFKAYPNFDKDGYCKTALESLHTLLQANDIYFENRELKWKTFDTEEKYKEAQSKVWDKERTYLFIKVD